LQEKNEFGMLGEGNENLFMKQPDRYLPLQMKKRDIFFNNLIGGIGWGVGSALGATLVVGILGYFISQSKTLPFVGKIVETTIQEVQKQQDSLQHREK
jgi:hypothetical protein